MIGTNARNPRTRLPNPDIRPAMREGTFAPTEAAGDLPAILNAPAPSAAGAISAMTPPQVRPANFMEKAGAWLHQPGTAAALFRSGAETLRNGIGSGLAAGAGYMDERKSAEAKQDQLDAENALAERGASLRELEARQRDALGWAGVGVDVGRLDETKRSNMAREGIDANGQRIQLYGIDTNASTARRGQDVSLQANREDNATQERGQDLGFQSSTYGTNLNYLSDASKYGATGGAGIGTKAYTETKTKIPGKPGSGGFFGMGASEATPDQVVTTRVPIVPGAPGSAGDPPQQAIEALKGNPNLRAQFDTKYGAGRSAQYLGGR